jgi:hypothetical protein
VRKPARDAAIIARKRADQISRQIDGMNAVLVDCSLSAEDVMLRERGRILSQLQAAMPRPTGNPNVHELTTGGETFSYVTEEESGPLPASHGRRPTRGAAAAGPLPITLPASLASGPATEAYGPRFAAAAVENPGTLASAGAGAAAHGAAAGGGEGDEAQAALRRVLAAIDRSVVPENEFEEEEEEEEAAQGTGGRRAGGAGAGAAAGGAQRAQPGAVRGGTATAARAPAGAIPTPAAARTVLPKPGVPGMSTSRELPKGAAAATLHALGEASHSGGPEFTAEGARRHAGGVAAAGPASAAPLRAVAAAIAGDAVLPSAVAAGLARRVAFAAQDEVHPIAASDPPAARINPRAGGFAATSGSYSALKGAAPAAHRGVRFGGGDDEAEDAGTSAAVAAPAGYSAVGASYPASAGAASARAAAGGLSASAGAVPVGRGGSSRSAGGGGGGAFKGTVMERAPPVRIAMPGLQAGVSAPVTSATAAVPTAGGTRRSLFSASLAGASAASRDEPERAQGRAAASETPQAGGADSKPRSLFMRSMHSS